MFGNKKHEVRAEVSPLQPQIEELTDMSIVAHNESDPPDASTEGNLESEFVEVKTEVIDIDEPQYNALEGESICDPHEETIMVPVKRELADSDSEDRAGYEITTETIAEKIKEDYRLEEPLFIAVKEEPNCESILLSPASSSKMTGKQYKGKKDLCCETCGKFFPDNANLERHRRIHTGEKPYPCSKCEKSFREKFKLTLHMRVHSGQRPYKCLTCEKSFKQKGHLHVHSRSHTGEKPFECKLCGVAFSYGNVLTSHMRTHTGEKPYKCNVCEKAFLEKSTLAKHMRIHTSDRPFKCNHCEKAFKRNDALKEHLRVHTGERPFICTDCGSSFTRSTSLSDHRNRIHDIASLL